LLIDAIFIWFCDRNAAHINYTGNLENGAGAARNKMLAENAFFAQE